MASYLVTGGCGFIGSYLVESLLSNGHQVRILDDLSSGTKTQFTRDVELVVADVRYPKVVEHCMREMDGCFHLAAVASVERSHKDWLNSHDVNVVGSLNVFKAASRKGTPVVYASSAAVYGNNADIPLTEESVTKPVSAYGADKLSCEHHARVASIVHGVPTMGFRLFNVYGSGQNTTSVYGGVVSIFIERLVRCQDLVIWGDGQQTRDFVYIRDAVTFLEAGMKHMALSPGILNVCTGKKTAINQLAKTLLAMSGNLRSIRYKAARTGDIVTSVGDPSRAQNQLGLTTTFSLYAGLQEMLDDHHSQQLLQHSQHSR